MKRLKLVAKASNWVLRKLNEPPIFSTMPDQEPRYWRELVQYLRNLPIRIIGKVPPIPLREVPHNELHPYDGTGRLGDITPKRHIDACYMDPPPMDFCTVEQFNEELDIAFKVAEEYAKKVKED